MKKTLLMAAVVVLAACGEKKAEAPAADSVPAMTPAPAPTMDSAAAPADSAAVPADSTMARDTAAKQ